MNQALLTDTLQNVQERRKKDLLHHDKNDLIILNQEKN